MALAINDTAPDFEARDHRRQDQIPRLDRRQLGACCSRTPRISPRSAPPSSATWRKIKPEFDKRGVKIIGLSVDPVEHHADWAADIKETQGFAPNYPMIGDIDFNVSKLYGMLPAAVVGRSGQAHAGRQPDRPQRLHHRPGQEDQTDPGLSDDGRPQLRRGAARDRTRCSSTAKHKVATPANWKHGEDVIIAGSVTDDDAKKLFPQGWKSPKPYIRIVPQPK